MKKIIKFANSRILLENLRYTKGNSKQNKYINEILLEEQQGFCAYTECRLTASTVARDVEYFDPRLKYTLEDHYENWFSVSHQWNLKKKDILSFLPILHPTAEDFEQRVWFNALTGEYECHNQDVEARNLIEYLMLNDVELLSDRLQRIELIQCLIDESGQQSFSLWRETASVKELLIEFRRAIETVFQITL